MSTKKIILTIVLIIFALLIGAVIWRYNVLNNLSEKYEQSLKNTNLYYHSDAQNTILDYWRKDDIIKIAVTNISTNTQLIQWKNAETNESLSVFPTSKTYSDDNGFLMFSSLPTSQFVGKDAPIFLTSVIPVCLITPKEYNGQKCYSISAGGEKEYISMETGLMIYNYSAGEECTRTYSFGTVTDKDVEKPDVTGFTYQQ